MRPSDRVDVLVERLKDRRGGRVVFLSHCLLDENARYLGGACRSGCVREVVQPYVDEGVGIVQLPCPEQAAWGGVRKRRMLRLYGAGWAHRMRGAVAPIAGWLTRRAYRKLARRVAAQIADYVASGVEVIGVVGVDGSPSCGVATTMDLRGAIAEITTLDPRTITIDAQDALVRRHARPGQGLFVAALAAELARRGIAVPLRAHDLLGELASR